MREPRPHQREAIAAAVSALTVEDRVQVIMACGRLLCDCLVLAVDTERRLRA